MPRELLSTHTTEKFVMDKYADGLTVIIQREHPGRAIELTHPNTSHQLIALLMIAESHPFGVGNANSFWMQLLTAQRQYTALGSPAYNALERIIQDICMTANVPDDGV